MDAVTPTPPLETPTMKHYLVTVEIVVDAEDVDAAAELAFTRRWLNEAEVVSVGEVA